MALNRFFFRRNIKKDWVPAPTYTLLYLSSAVDRVYSSAQPILLPPLMACSLRTRIPYFAERPLDTIHLLRGILRFLAKRSRIEVLAT